MTRCDCDACTAVGTFDGLNGLCEFCATRCFPAVSTGGRMAMSRESRLLLHRRHADRNDVSAARADELIGAAIGLIGDKKTRGRAEAAVYLARTLGPHVAPAARAILGKILRRG